MRVVAAIAIAARLLLHPALAHADERASLAGLNRVTVLVDVNNGEKDDAQIVKAGLTMIQLRTDTELRLRKSGVQVVDDEQYVDLLVKESPQVADIGTLFLSVTAVCVPQGCFYTIRPSLSQRTTLVRDPARVFEAATWNGGGRVGFVPEGVLGAASKVRSALGDCVDGFLNEYLAANPSRSR